MKKEQLAYKRGYRITENGDVIGRRGFALRPEKNRKGYFIFYLRDEGSQKKIKVLYHRLQAFQKYGNEMYEPKIMVRHLNSNKEDNSFSNIAIGTAKDNYLDIPESIRLARNIYPSFFNKKHDYDLVKAFYKKSNRSYLATMNEFGITSSGTLHYILNKNS